MNTSDSKEYNHLKRNFWIILITFNLVFIVTALIAVFSQKDYSVNQKQNARLIGASYMTMNNEFYKIMSEEISARVIFDNVFCLNDLAGIGVAVPVENRQRGGGGMGV